MLVIQEPKYVWVPLGEDPGEGETWSSLGKSRQTARRKVKILSTDGRAALLGGHVCVT